MIPVRRALRTRGAERLPPRTWENSLNSAGDLPISSNIFTQLPCLHRSRWLFTVPLCTGDPTKPTAKPAGHHRFYAWGWFTNLKCLVTKVVISHNPCLAMSILKTLNWHWSNVVQLSRRVTCWGEPVLQLASLCQQLSRVLRHSTTQFEEGLILNHWQLLATSIILNHSESFLCWNQGIRIHGRGFVQYGTRYPKFDLKSPKTWTATAPSPRNLGKPWEPYFIFHLEDPLRLCLKI